VGCRLPVPAGRIDLSDVRVAWPAMTLDERREVLRMFIGEITIHRAKPGAR
jgi:site-specific DNA recombinase